MKPISTPESSNCSSSCRLTGDALEEAVHRTNMYGVFARSLRPPQEQDESWSRQTLLPALKNEASRQRGLRRITQDAFLAISDSEISDLSERQRQFHTLFDSHGPMTAPPYETEYLKDWPQQALLLPAILADIQGFYRAFGLEIAKKSAERCDHIRLELEFLHFLGLKEVIAIQLGESEHLEVVQSAQRRFLEGHASRWAAKFADRLEARRAPSLYVKIGRLLHWWIEGDMVAQGCQVSLELPLGGCPHPPEAAP